MINLTNFNLTSLYLSSINNFNFTELSEADNVFGYSFSDPTPLYILGGLGVLTVFTCMMGRFFEDLEEAQRVLNDESEDESSDGERSDETDYDDEDLELEGEDVDYELDYPDDDAGADEISDAESEEESEDPNQLKMTDFYEKVNQD